MLTSITPKHPNKISDSEIPSALNRTPSISQNTGLKKEIVSNGAGSLLTGQNVPERKDKGAITKLFTALI